MNTNQTKIVVLKTIPKQKKPTTNAPNGPYDYLSILNVPTTTRNQLQEEKYEIILKDVREPNQKLMSKVVSFIPGRWRLGKTQGELLDEFLRDRPELLNRLFERNPTATITDPGYTITYTTDTHTENNSIYAENSSYQYGSQHNCFISNANGNVVSNTSNATISNIEGIGRDFTSLLNDSNTISNWLLYPVNIGKGKR